MKRVSPPSPLVYWQRWHVTWARFLAEMRARPRTPWQWVYLFLWAFYLVSYPIAVTGVAFDVRPGFSMAWAGSILLFVQGALAALWLVQRLGTQRGGLVVLVVVLGAFVGETVGVATGFPFGPYHYTGILFPGLPGSVPLPVIGAWLLVVATSVGVARWVLADAKVRSLPRAILLATVLGVALDLVLEPVAVKLEGYWVWRAGGPYLGIPTSNFVGWAALCAVLCGAVLWVCSRGGARRVAAAVAPLPNVAQSALWLYVLTDAMFAFIDLTHGLWVAAVVGMSTLGCLALRGRAAYDRE